MKKQHFLLVLMLAFFAGISNGYTQCTPDGFTPATGVPYTYVVTIPGGSGYSGVGTYNWYVTQNTDILTGIIPEINTFFTVNETPPFSTYNDNAGTSNQLNLTWKTVNGTFYLVLRYSETNTNANPTCAAENIRVWQITPINTFLLAIEGATNTGNPFANANQCAAPLLSAAVIAGPNVTYTYGQNVIYYRVTASGILGAWKPSIQIPALAGLGQNYNAVEWNQQIDGSGTWNSFNVPPANTAGGEYASTLDANVTDAVNGTPILIRIKIDNVNYETLNDQPILIGIDGYLPPTYAAPYSDIWGPGTWPGNPDPCSQATAFAKTAVYTILARPTINPGPGMPNFITKNP